MNITAQQENFIKLIDATNTHDLAAGKWLVRSPHCTINGIIDGGIIHLHFACSITFSDCLVTLLQRAADPNYPDDSGQTPLHYGSSVLDITDLVQPLLGHRANLALMDHAGQTALHVAASRGLPNIIKLLINRSAHIGVRDSRHRTPLHNASLSCDVASVLALLSAGADPHAVDAASLSPRTRSRALPFKLSKSRCQCSFNRKDDPIFGSTSSGHESAAKNAPDRASDHSCTSKMRS